MWRTFFKIFGARVVMTIDNDGEVRFSFARQTPAGLVCSKIIGNILLHKDGTTSGSYVKSWIEL